MRIPHILTQAVKVAIVLSALSSFPLPAAAGQSPLSTATLRQQIKSDPKQAIPVLKAALADKNLALPDRLWAMSELASGLRKGLKYAEALALIRQGQQEAAGIPIQVVVFARQAINIHLDMGNNQLALSEYTRIAPLLPTLSGSSGELIGNIEAAKGWLSGGIVMSKLGQLPEAMELLVRALQVFDANSGEAKSQAATLNHISVVHFKTGNTEAAVREVQKAIDIAASAKIPEELTLLYMRKAHYMSSTGNVEAQYEALMQARALALEDDETFNQAVIATNLADVALQRHDYEGTLRFVAEAIPLVEKSGDRESLLICWINRGIALNRLGKPEGLLLIKQAIAEFSKTPGMQDVAADVQGTLAEELARNKDFEQAYAAAVDFKKRHDAVRSASDQKRVADSAARYQADKKQRQIEVLEQEQRAQKRVQMLWVLVSVLGVLTAVILLISRAFLQRAYKRVAEMSLSDPLTGLRNRRYLASRIDEDLAQGGRQHLTHQRAGDASSNSDVVFIMIDLDHFKSVNDQHGHAAGDAVLKQFSAILMEEVRESDTVVRWGGEEFLIVAKQASSGEIHLLAERIRAHVASHDFDIGNGTVLHKTCSIGFANYSYSAPMLPQPRWEDVVSIADQCLYAAKASGRDMWVGVVPGRRSGEMPRQLDVRLGIKDGVFELQHSPTRQAVWPNA